MKVKAAFWIVLGVVSGLGGSAWAQDTEPAGELQILGSNERGGNGLLCYFEGKAFSIGAHKTMAGSLFRCARSAGFGASWSQFPPESYCKEGEHSYPSGAMIRQGEGDAAKIVSCENGSWVEG